MTQLTAYVIINGDKSKIYPFLRTVKNQSEIELHRSHLFSKHKKDKEIYDIFFHMKSPMKENRLLG